MSISASDHSDDVSPARRYGTRSRRIWRTAETICLDSEDSQSQCSAGDSTRSRQLFNYPPLIQGENMKGSIPMYLEDIECLKPETFLNDNIIDFWLHYIYNEDVNIRDRDNIVVLSSLFYGSLVQQIGAKAPSKSSRWTKRIDNLFLKEFIFVPVPIDGHWILAVVCHPGLVCLQQKIPKWCYSPELDEPIRLGQSEDEVINEVERHYARYFLNRKRKLPQHRQPYPLIIILDSYQDLGVDCNKIGENLRIFLANEWAIRSQTKCEFDDITIPLTIPLVPQQDNYYDCGIFTLQFFESFFSSPLKSFILPLRPMTDWFPKKNVQNKREEIFETIVELVQSLHPDRSHLLPKRSQFSNPSQVSPDSPDIPSDDDDEYIPLLPTVHTVPTTHTNSKKLETSTPRRPSRSKSNEPKKRKHRAEPTVELIPRLFYYPELEGW